VKILAAPEKEFALKLRVPGWAKKSSVHLNHRPTEVAVNSSGYHELRRTWKAGDTVDLDLAMETEFIEANPLVEETLGQVAVKRGPIVYCAESIDLPKGIKPLNLLISSDTKLHARYDQRLLGGVVVLEGTTAARTDANWKNQLYREWQPTKLTSVKLRLIPYSVWANRGPSEMSVWLPRSNP
jgi:DUF1680 family protein